MMSRIHFSADLASDTREQKMFDDGVKRYQKREARLATAGVAGERDDYSQFLKTILVGMAERIDQYVEANGKGRGKANKVITKLSGIPSITVAYLGLTTMFSTLARKNDRNVVVSRIGNALEDEARFTFIAEQQPKLWERLQRYAAERATYRSKKTFALNVAAHEGVVAEEWEGEGTASLVGAVVLKLIEEAGVIRTVSDTAGDHTTCTVELTEETVNWLTAYRQRAEIGDVPMVTPVFAPLTERPVDWTRPVGGGYRKIRLPFVKAGKADYRSADMSRVYRAVNTMQSTAWHINSTMLELVNGLWATGDEVGKLPSCVAKPVPARLSAEEWEAMSAEDKKGRRIALRDVHEHNREAASSLVSIDQILAQARDLKEAPHVYIPYQVDYRGRVYAVPMLNPQGPDFIRCLFEFAHGKPVGERGGMWLAIQAASLYDGQHPSGRKLSKCSFQERYAWAEENEDLLRSVVANPLADNRWQDADKPFMFLRTAIDYVGFLDQGEDFVSGLPIALDGSCSGIQHYSALLRDPVGGASVNLLPAERPADVYGDVAEAVLAEVQADDDEKNADARAFWLEHGIDRKVLKKPVMTYGYSSREAGFTEWYEGEFVRPAFKKLGKQGGTNPIARYLAKKTMAAVEKRLVATAHGMEWMIELAKLTAHEGKPIDWVAPSGFPVRQSYVKSSFVRVETQLQGERIRVAIPGTDKTISKEKQKSAISPNHTHSLDAAHLILTVLHALDEYGITDFSLIHDSFGTLPADTDALFSAVREAFVSMYESCDPFQHLYESVSASLSEEGRAKLTPPPSKGDLDLSTVLQSLYSFA